MLHSASPPKDRSVPNYGRYPLVAGTAGTAGTAITKKVDARFTHGAHLALESLLEENADRPHRLSRKQELSPQFSQEKKFNTIHSSALENYSEDRLKA